MKRKNKKLIVIVSCLLLVISVSLAYYIGQILINGEGAKGNATTAKIKGATLTVEGKLEFNDSDILPGYKTISSIKVTATGNNELIPYNLIWKGTNGISKINYTVYKTSSEINVSASCEKKATVQNGVQILNEECSITNLDNLGSFIASGSIIKNSTKEILTSDEFITATNDGDTKYYYVILEYPNLDEDQSSDMDATFEGIVTVEESNATSDINIMAVYLGDEVGNYTETTDIPGSGYILSEKSTCSNNAVPVWDYNNSGLLTKNLTKSGTSCYLYFNKLKTVNTILGNIEVNPEVKTIFDKAAIADEGVQSGIDEDGTTYYWRGAATTNYLKFAGYCWRIVRINGSGTIRLIYSGNTCQPNTAILKDAVISVSAFNSISLDNAYVGYMYGTTDSNTYEETHANINNSTIKEVLDEWYKTNILEKGYDGYVAKEDGFCNDRTIIKTAETGYVGDGYNKLPTSYGPFGRFVLDNDFIKKNMNPTFLCSQVNDLFTYNLATKGNKMLSYPVGLITVDEVIFAGGYSQVANANYYLNIGVPFWTMSPYHYHVEYYAVQFGVYADGRLQWLLGNEIEHGVRPVINLRSDIQILDGDGTIDNPYVV